MKEEKSAKLSKSFKIQNSKFRIFIPASGNFECGASAREHEEQWEELANDQLEDPSN